MAEFSLDAPPFVRIEQRFWRVLSPKWASEPLSGAGAAARGGRWNEPGVPALYLSETHGTAIAEYNQSLERPGTFAPYDALADRIVDLCDPAVLKALAIPTDVATCAWKTISRIDGRRPPTWDVAARLIAAGAQGARVPSAQGAGVNVVLWRWNEPNGAAVSVVDPFGDLSA